MDLIWEDYHRGMLKWMDLLLSSGIMMELFAFSTSMEYQYDWNEISLSFVIFFMEIVVVFFWIVLGKLNGIKLKV